MTTLFEQAAAKNVVMIQYPELLDDVVEPVVEAPVTVDWAAVAAADEAATEERVQDAHAAGFAEARAEFEAKMVESLDIERTAIAMACASFGKARERYFGEIEAEVVKLALAIAARVLQREVKMDPTLLAGVVRVALSKLSDLQGAVLRVSTDEAEMWRRAMKSVGIQVEENPRMPAGEVQLHTPGGVAELGIEAQLVEVERGFFDLLAKRPA